MSILLLLLKRDKVTAPELAAYFETSLRTIYRDMRPLLAGGFRSVRNREAEGDTP